MILYVTKNPSLKTNLETEKRFKPPTSTSSVKCFLGCPDNPKMGKMMMQMAMLPLGPWQFCSWNFSPKIKASCLWSSRRPHHDTLIPEETLLKPPLQLETCSQHWDSSSCWGWCFTIQKKPLLFFERPRHFEIYFKYSTKPASLLSRKKQLAPSSTISGSILPYHLAPPSHQVFCFGGEPRIHLEFFLPDARIIYVHTDNLCTYVLKLCNDTNISYISYRNTSFQWMYCNIVQNILHIIYTHPETNSSPLKISQIPKRNDRNPTTSILMCENVSFFRQGNTVDGKNPAPVDMVNIPSFAKFYTSQVVVWDFWTINSMTYQEAPPSGSTWPLQCLVLPAGSVALPGPRCPRHLNETATRRCCNGRRRTLKHEEFWEWTKPHPLLKMKLYHVMLAQYIYMSVYIYMYIYIYIIISTWLFDYTLYLCMNYVMYVPTLDIILTRTVYPFLKPWTCPPSQSNFEWITSTLTYLNPTQKYYFATKKRVKLGNKAHSSSAERNGVKGNHVQHRTIGS